MSDVNHSDLRTVKLLDKTSTSLLSGDAFAFGGTNVDPCFVKSWSTSGDADDRPTEEAGAHALYDLVVPTAPDSSAVATLIDFDL